MGYEVSIESECVVENLDFPTNVDHSWLFLAAGIHERLYVRTANDGFAPALVKGFLRYGESDFRLLIDDRYQWTDSCIVDASEVAAALDRGVRLGIFKSIDIESNCTLRVSTSRHVVDEALLASPLFTVTPSCRAKTSIATCGGYRLISSSGAGRTMSFRRRDGRSQSLTAPEMVHVLVTEDREHGLSLMRKGQLTLSCPLGASVTTLRNYEARNTIINRETNLAAVLRPYHNCWITHSPEALDLIESALNRQALSAITNQMFLPISDLDCLFSPTDEMGSRACVRAARQELTICGETLARLQNEPIEIGYADFHPNYEIAKEIQDQLSSKLAIASHISSRPYTDYVRSEFPARAGLSLEIIQPLTSKESFLFHFIEITKKFSPISLRCRDCVEPSRPIVIPLLRATTSQVSLDSRYANRRILTAEAIINWTEL